MGKLRESCGDDNEKCIEKPKDKCNIYTCSEDKVFAVKKGECDDGNSCTTDSCDPQLGCVYTAIKCFKDLCHDSYCHPECGSCLHKARNVDDGDSCTIDKCDPETGECVYEQKLLVPGSCDKYARNKCKNVARSHRQTCERVAREKCFEVPNDKCNVYGCRNGEAYKKDSVQYDDGNKCTDDSCNPQTGCVFEQKACEAADKCSVGYCDPQSGNCVFQALKCDDGNPCTQDICNPLTGEMSHKEKVCQPKDACHTAQCDRASGKCVQTAIKCDDGNPCTIDKCDPSTGQI